MSHYKSKDCCQKAECRSFTDTDLKKQPTLFASGFCKGPLVTHSAKLQSCWNQSKVCCCTAKVYHASPQPYHSSDCWTELLETNRTVIQAAALSTFLVCRAKVRAAFLLSACSAWIIDMSTNISKRCAWPFWISPANLSFGITQSTHFPASKEILQNTSVLNHRNNFTHSLLSLCNI